MGVVQRFYGFISSCFSLRKLFNENSFDVVVLYAVPTYGLQIISLSNKHKTPVVFRALDVSHELRQSILKPIIKLIERRIYKRSDILSANNVALMEYCIELSGREGVSTVNLPPLDLSHFRRDVKQYSKTELGISGDKRIVVYMGSFFRFSGLLQVIRDFYEQGLSDKHVVLLLIGGGEIFEEVSELVKQLRLEDCVIMTGIIDYKNLPSYLKLAEIAINPFEKTLVTDKALPHKIFQYMASDLPVVSTSLAGARGVLGENSGLTWVENPAQVISAVIQLLGESSEQLDSIAKLQQQSVSELFDENKIFNQMLETLELSITQ